MNESKLKDQINTSFKSETPDILDKIKSSDQFFVPDKARKSSFNTFFNKRLSYSLASVFILAIILFSIISLGTEIDPVVASTVTIDINPSIEITLDDDDVVINIIAINDDGDYLIDRDIEYQGLTLDRTIEIIIAKALELGYIVDSVDDNIILINVESNQYEIQTRVEQALENKITQVVNNASKRVQVRKENRDNLTRDEANNLIREAKDLKISVSKLIIINKIIAEDDSYTIYSLKNLSVMRLYQLLNQLVTDE